MATEFTKLVFKEEKTSAQWSPEAQILNIWFFSARNPESKLDLQFWYPLIFIHSKFRRDHDHEWYKQMKSSQNIQRLGHTKFTSCSSDFVLKTLERASDLKMLISFAFFLFVCHFWKAGFTYFYFHSENDRYIHNGSLSRVPNIA